MKSRMGSVSLGFIAFLLALGAVESSVCPSPPTDECRSDITNWEALDAAIQSAPMDSTIALCPGTIYKDNGDQKIKIMSQRVRVACAAAAGDDECVIQGGGGHFFIRYTSEVIFQGLTFRDATDRSIHIYDGTNKHTICDCKFINNVYQHKGSAVTAEINTNVVIDSCSFQQNVAHEGPGIYNRAKSLEVINTEFVGNKAVGPGGAIKTSGSSDSLTVSSCLFKNNTAWAGPAVFVYNNGKWTDGGGNHGSGNVARNSLECESFYTPNGCISFQPGVPFQKKITTEEPSASPTEKTTMSPTQSPTSAPTSKPSSASPSASPTSAPTSKPSSASPSASPISSSPTTSSMPSGGSKLPTQAPTARPSLRPSDFPSASPTGTPTKIPTESPTKIPTKSPTMEPTKPPVQVRTIVHVPPTYSFELRLYWKKGYMWQEEPDERWWCMKCAKCEGGLGPRYCKHSDCHDGDRLWTFDCRHVPRPIRLQVIRGNQADQLKLKDKNLCIQKDGARALVMRPCDGDATSQKFVGFQPYGIPFDLRHKHKPDGCMTQHHHPKPMEVIFLEHCRLAHYWETGNWVTWNERGGP